MHRRAFLAAASLPLLPAATRRGLDPQYESQILRLMQVAPVPGAVVGRLEHGKLAWTHPLGIRDFETKAPITADTAFQAASLSKQIAAYAAFALRDQGKLDFDQPLVHYVDDLPAPQARTVKIRHVLSHSSGFPNWRFEAGQQLVPQFEPGTQYRYSGEGFVYLQRILEQVTGQGYGTLIDTLVFRPLGMTSSSAMWKPELADRFALPHNDRGELRKFWDGGAKRVFDAAKDSGARVADWRYPQYAAVLKGTDSPQLPNWILPNAAASMVTTANDYAKFIAAAMRNPDIGKEQIKIRPDIGWGLGWAIERFPNGQPALWQWGDNGGYKNIVIAEPATGQATFVFTNGDAGRRIYDSIIRHVTGKEHPALFFV